MKQVVVLGIGNRLMQDDGIGVYVVEKLREQNTTGSIRYIAGETDIDYCLDRIQEAAFIIIIDAARIGEKPGHVTVMPLDKAISAPAPGLSPHNLHIFDMIGFLNKSLNGILVGITVSEISYNLGLSPALHAKFPDIVLEVQNIIQQELY